MTDFRLGIPKKKLFIYPEVTVVAGELEFLENRTDTIINPRLIAEVLSDSKNYEPFGICKAARGEKFESYRTLPSFRENILIDQYKIHVEHSSKTANK